MQKYKWKGINKYGESERGILYAVSEEDLRVRLLEQEVALLSCKTKKNLKKSISTEELATFFENLHDLLSSGIKLIDALKLAKNGASSIHFKKNINLLIKKVDCGSSLSKAMEDTQSFTQGCILYAIKAGEQSNSLPEFLKNISTHLKKQSALLKKLRRAALLPAITLAFSVTIIFMVLVFVIPQFETIFKSLNKELPKETKMILGVSKFLCSKMFFYSTAALFLLFFAFKKGCEFISKNFTQKIILKIPIAGKIITLSSYHSFLQSFSILLKSGLAMKEAIKIAKTTSANKFLRNEFDQIESFLEMGHPLHEAFQKSSVVAQRDPQLKNIIAFIEIGEQTGSLYKTLEKSAVVIEKKLDAQAEFLSTIFQPVLLLILGFFIAIIIYSIYLPLFDAALCFS
jgi:type IV pilus assembly protein PilC